VAGLQWVIANKSTYNIRILNLSMGHAVGESYTTDPLCQAVEKAWNAGIVVVCAAGNDGRQSDIALPSNGTDNEGYGTAYGSIASPGNDPYVITVGAMKSIDGNRANDTIATYSSRGPCRLDLTLKPDIVAPGNQVISLRSPLSTLNLSSPTNQVPLSDYCSNPPLLGQSSYFKLSGTSMATPVVSGAVALLLEAKPTLSPDTIKARLMLTADKWTDPQGYADPCTYGAGYLNIPKALKCQVVPKRPARSPALIQDSSGNVNVDLNSILSGGSIWGTDVTDLRAVWGTRAIWGSNTLSSSRAIWGTSVWGDRAIWGTDVFSIDLGPIVLNGD
jgi:serine protease AprX